MNRLTRRSFSVLSRRARVVPKQGLGQARFIVAEATVAAVCSKVLPVVGGAIAGGIAYWAFAPQQPAGVDYNAVREDIIDMLDNDDYDDGSIGPVLVRLAWHASGTFSKFDNTGGSDRASMRFKPESDHGGNAGLIHARDFLEPLKQKYPALSYADLWSLAGAVAIEELGGPRITWRPGRSDSMDERACTPDGRLPDASQGAAHIRDVFYRMGFEDKDIVVLSGAHALGRCHTDRSGFDGPWTHSPTTFSNSFFTELLTSKWHVRNWNGPLQYQDQTNSLMMLPTDMALVQDDKFREWVVKYAEDEELFFADFASAFQKLQEVGCRNLQEAKF